MPFQRGPSLDYTLRCTEQVGRTGRRLQAQGIAETTLNPNPKRQVRSAGSIICTGAFAPPATTHGHTAVPTFDTNVRICLQFWRRETCWGREASRAVHTCTLARSLPFTAARAHVWGGAWDRTLRMTCQAAAACSSDVSVMDMQRFMAQLCRRSTWSLTCCGNRQLQEAAAQQAVTQVCANRPS